MRAALRRRCSELPRLPETCGVRQVGGPLIAVMAHATQERRLLGQPALSCGTVIVALSYTVNGHSFT